MKRRKRNRPIFVALAILIITVIISIASIPLKYIALEIKADRAKPLYKEGYLYYNSLSYRDQLLYNSIYNAAKSCDEYTKTIPYRFNMEEFQSVIKCVRADNPQLFYVEYNDLILYHSSHKTRVGMVYCDTNDRVKEMISEYENVLKKADELIEPSMSDFEIELVLHDYLVNTCEYVIGESSPINNTAYGALVLKRAYCDGYAYAMKELLKRNGIFSAVVFGVANKAEHVWNIVKIDDCYYHLDVMWNDADLSYGEDMLFHGYFNLNDKQISLDHNFDGGTIIPKADKDNCFYQQTGCFAENEEVLEDVIYTALHNAVTKGQAYIELMCKTTKDNEIISPYFINAIKRVNKDKGKDILFEGYRIFNASSVSNALTVQIFYN